MAGPATTGAAPPPQTSAPSAATSDFKIVIATDSREDVDALVTGLIDLLARRGFAGSWAEDSRDRVVTLSCIGTGSPGTYIPPDRREFSLEERYFGKYARSRWHRERYPLLHGRRYTAWWLVQLYMVDLGYQMETYSWDHVCYDKALKWFFWPDPKFDEIRGFR